MEIIESIRRALSVITRFTSNLNRIYQLTETSKIAFKLNPKIELEFPQNIDSLYDDIQILATLPQSSTTEFLINQLQIQKNEIDNICNNPIVLNNLNEDVLVRVMSISSYIQLCLVRYKTVLNNFEVEKENESGYNNNTILTILELTGFFDMLEEKGIKSHTKPFRAIISAITGIKEATVRRQINSWGKKNATSSETYKTKNALTHAKRLFEDIKLGAHAPEIIELSKKQLNQVKK